MLHSFAPSHSPISLTHYANRKAKEDFAHRTSSLFASTHIDKNKSQRIKFTDVY